ncbi:unnamed protein product [Prorocentrum cordatum]|uniref:Uncharacterized protein n=1 Tax=Prorocentrum cordatum TaxID=2364126 RepID=A0ABN9QHM4_9DINO|nr:unnamed protein product [Polarella glacialis]
MTERRWRASGSEMFRGLKEKFTQLPSTQRTASFRCSSKSDDNLDCTWRQYDALLCEGLELAGMQNNLGNMKMVQAMMMSYVQSSLNYGLDWKARAGMIAKWRDPGWHARGRLDEREFNLVKASIISKPAFQKVVNTTCEGLDGVRPHCREFAPRALFCDALGQAAVAIHSAKDVAHRLEQDPPRREGSLPPS